MNFIPSWSGIVTHPCVTILSVLLLSVGTLHAKALLRETSPRQNALKPIPDKELVFARGAEGTVAAYLGLDGGTVQVVDPAAIRVARATPFEVSELYVDESAATSVVDVSGKGTAYKGIITVTNINKEAIGRIESVQHQFEGPAVPVTNEMTVTIDGCVATVTITGDGPGLFLQVYPSVLNTSIDLTKEDVTLTDAVGTIRLSQMRQDLIERTRGNLGQDWSLYKAKHPVDLDNKLLLFGNTSGTAIQGSVGQIALYTGAQPAVVAESFGDDGTATSGTLLITDFRLGDDTVAITLSLTGIPVESIALQYSGTIVDANWLTVPGTTITANADGTVTISGPRDTSSISTGFWRVISDQTISTVVSVNGDLNVLGGILMKSPNGTKWRINVTDDGTLSVVSI